MRKYYNAPMDLQSRFVALKSFLLEHEQLLQTEPLNHYPCGLPSPYGDWINQLRGREESELIQAECFLQTAGMDNELESYFLKIKELSLLEDSVTEEAPLLPQIQRGMTLKKRHEAARIKAYLCGRDYRSFLDIGSGKGHLSMALLADTDGKSTCVDMDSALQSAGLRKIKTNLPSLAEKITYITKKFEADSDINSQESSLILGLHCCGDFSVDIMDFHLPKEMDLLSFGCCYHKSTRFNLSELAKGSPFQPSFHALTLATRSNRILDSEAFRRRKRVKLYRYILHMILVDEFGEEFTTLGSAHHSDYSLTFREYAQKHTPRTQDLDLEFLYEKHIQGERLEEFLLAETIRAPLGRLLELYILLDRAIYLQENGRQVEFKCFFDSELSPRNVGIFSKKH